MTDIQQAQDSKPQPSAGRFTGIVAIFALLGPPIGGLTVAVCFGVMAANSGLVATTWVEALRAFAMTTIFTAVFGLPLSYIVGIGPAAGTGVAVAAWDMRRGVISWLVALGASIVFGTLAILRADEIISTDEGVRFAQIAIALAHLVSAVACWAIARAIFGLSRSRTHPGPKPHNG
jgi:hypothetical protein